MKKSNTLLLLLLFATAILTGCMGGEPTPEDIASLKTKAADFLGTSPQNITVSNINSGIIAIAYKVNYNGEIYNCYRHNLYRFVECKKPGY